MKQTTLESGNPNPKKILVIGLGPAGGIFAAYLSASGYHVYGIDSWSEHVHHIRSNGLRIANFTDITVHLQEVALHVEQLPETVFDYVVVAVKASVIQHLIPTLQSLPGPFKLVILQNGLDNEEYFSQFFPRERLLRVAVNYAGNMVAPGLIRMNFFQKPNQIGCICQVPDCTHAAEISQIMTMSALDTEAVADIRKYTWKKAIMNAILAPIATILGVTMADVMADPGTRFIVESLIRESIQVAKAAGYDYGDDFFDRCVDFLLKAGAHKPSMLIDMENGNPTEIDYINGKIAAFGNQFHIPVPFNTTMTALVKAQELHHKKRREK